MECEENFRAWSSQAALKGPVKFKQIEMMDYEEYNVGTSAMPVLSEN